jgi:copper transport protein
LPLTRRALVSPGRRLFVAATIVVVGVVGWAAPASAHASVVSSTPAQGAHLLSPPSSVTVVFDQPVKPDHGGLVVLNAAGANIDSGPSTHPSPTVLQVGVRSSIGDGAYVADYTVTSVDGHVVSGGIVFLVGNASAASVAHLTRSRTSVATWVDDAGQFLTYLGVLIAAGLAFFLAFILLDDRDGEGLRRWVVLATVVAGVGMIVTVAAQASLAYGGIAAVGHWSALWPAVDGKLGAQFAVQCVGLAACLASLVVRVRLARQFAAFYGMLLAAGAFVLFGHALVSRERWMSIPADIVHAVFAAMWLGGLIGLVVVLRRHIQAARSAGDFAAGTVGIARRRETVVAAESGASGGGVVTASTAVLERDDGPGPRPSGDELDRFAATVGILGRFSTMAGISFAAIAVAGILLAIAEVGSVSNLFHTGYGQLLLLKVALVGVLLVLAWYNRMLLLPVLLRTAGRGSAELRAAWPRLLGTVRLEALGVIAVLGVTSVLANGTPSNGAPSTLAAAKPFAQSQPFNGGQLSLRITPNQALVNQWTVTITDANGQPQNPESVSVYLVEPERNIGPIETDLRRAGPGTFELSGSPDPPVVGRWQIVVQVQVSAFSQLDASFIDTVNP